MKASHFMYIKKGFKIQNNLLDIFNSIRDVLIKNLYETHLKKDLLK